MMEWTKPPFKLTSKEILSSTAITLCLLNLEAANFPTFSVKEACFKPQYGFTASASNIPIGPHFLRITDIKEGTVDWQSVPFCECNDPDKYQLAKGDILVARTGSVGKTFLISDVPEKVVFASYLIRLPVKPNVNPEYLYLCFQSQQFWNQIMGMRRGSAIKNINAKMLQSLSFPYPSPEMQEDIVRFLDVFQQRLDGVEINLPELPPPLEEQQRIVARIESLAAKVEAARKLREEAEEKVNRVLDAAIQKSFEKIVEVESKPLFKLTSKIGSGSTPRGGRSVYVSSGIPFIRSQNVRMRAFQWDGIAYIDDSIHSNMKNTIVQSSDVLLNITGASIGRVACVPSELGEGNVNQHVSIIRPLDMLDPRYLMYWLSGPSVQNMINDKQKGATRQAITKTQIRNFQIPLPPLPEQRRIVAYLDALQTKVAAVQQHQAATQARLNALLPSILDQAFRGEL